MKQIFLILLLSGCFVSANAQICESLFGDTELYRSIHALAELRLQLDLAQTSNDDSITISLLKKEYPGKEKALLAYVVQNKLMTPKELVQHIKNEIVSIQKDRQVIEARVHTERRSQEIQGLGFRAVFNRVEPGKFLMGPPNSQREVKIENTFELMATTLTQFSWSQLESLVLKYGFHLAEAKITVEEERHPIHGLSWNEVMSFIKIINSLPKSASLELGKIFVGHKHGDQYDLPSEKEWEYVARARGKFTGEYPYDDKNRFNEFAWVGLRDKPEAVALKSPIMVDGKEFYDMLGNVYEWTKTFDRKPDHVVMRGHPAQGFVHDAGLNSKAWNSIKFPATAGIRLVRRLK